MALRRSFVVFGERPLYQAPIFLAAGFGMIASFMSLRLNKRATKATASIEVKTLLLDRIKIVLRSQPTL